MWWCTLSHEREREKKKKKWERKRNETKNSSDHLYFTITPTSALAFIVARQPDDTISSTFNGFESTIKLYGYSIKKFIVQPSNWFRCVFLNSPKIRPKTFRVSNGIYSSCTYIGHRHTNTHIYIRRIYCIYTCINASKLFATKVKLHVKQMPFVFQDEIIWNKFKPILCEGRW